jgi:hypothetical protein
MLLLLTLVNKFDVTLITGWNKLNCLGSVQLDQIELMVLNIGKIRLGRILPPNMDIQSMFS